MNLLAAIACVLSLVVVDATRLACRLERYEDCGEALVLMRVESRGVAVGLRTSEARAEAWRRGVGSNAR